MRSLWMLNVLSNRFWGGYFNSLRGQNGPIHTRLQESTAANASNTCQYPPRELHLASHWSGTENFILKSLCSTSGMILTGDAHYSDKSLNWCSLSPQKICKYLQNKLILLDKQNYWIKFVFCIHICGASFQVYWFVWLTCSCK